MFKIDLQGASGNNDAKSENALFIRHSGVLQPKMATFGRHDNIDYPFVDDEKVRSKWNSVGYVENAEDFVPNSDETEYYLKSSEFKNNGILIQKYMDEVWKEKWTKGLVICLHRTTVSPYFIQTIDGVEYLFMEWRMGNYIYGGCELTYYVFRR